MSKTEMLKTDFTREQRFLLSKKERFPKQTQADLAAGKLRFMDSDVMHTAKINDGGGIYDLLRTTNDKQVGISDFDSNKLDAGVNIGVGRIKFGYGKALAADNKTAADIKYSSKAADLPAELLRAKLIVKQDGKVLLRLPVERFTQEAASTKVQGEEDVLHLGTPFVLVEQKPIDVQLEFNPDAGIVAGTDDHFVQVRFIGTETSSK
jgi:hypothetical protein